MGETSAKQIPRIERGMTRIVVPSEGKETAFAYPAVGPDTYRTVGKNILGSGQKIPTGDDIASLVHAAYCVPKLENEPEFKNIREIRRRGWLWVFNRNIWTPKGVYVVHDSEAIGRSQPLNQADLEKMLKGGKDVNGIRFSRDKSVRFAPKGSYQLGKHTPESLAKDGFMIASYGIDGAEKLREVSAKLKDIPETFGVDVQEGQSSEQRVSAFGGCTGFNGDWHLDADGCSGIVGNGYCHAFGVLK